MTASGYRVDCHAGKEQEPQRTGTVFIIVMVVKIYQGGRNAGIFPPESVGKPGSGIKNSEAISSGGRDTEVNEEG
jgi:hypothetical protein